MTLLRRANGYLTEGKNIFVKISKSAVTGLNSWSNYSKLKVLKEVAISTKADVRHS